MTEVNMELYIYPLGLLHYVAWDLALIVGCIGSFDETLDASRLVKFPYSMHI